jgi:uncharacterized protein DUF6896
VAARCVTRLQSSLSHSNVLRAWRSSDIPQVGVTPWGRYEMHGYGCTVFLADVTIDVEFSIAIAIISASTAGAYGASPGDIPLGGRGTKT